MFCRRRSKGFLSPIFNKENADLSNCGPIESLKTNCTKRFTLNFDEDELLSKTKEQTVNLGFLTQKRDQVCISYALNTVRRQKGKDDAPTYCQIHPSPKNSLYKKQVLQLGIQPRCLNFIVNSTLVRDENSQQWDVNLVESICLDDVYSQDQDQIQKMHKEFLEYDMDSDKQNMPPSDDENDSSFDSQFFSQDQQNCQITPKKQALSRIHILSSKLEKNLQEIDEVDQATNTDAFQIHQFGEKDNSPLSLNDKIG